VSRYQKGKTNLDFTEARDSEWQWHQLGLVQVCTLLQTDNQASTPPLRFLQAGRWLPFLPPNQQHQSIEGKQFVQKKRLLNGLLLLSLYVISKESDLTDITFGWHVHPPKRWHLLLLPHVW